MKRLHIPVMLAVVTLGINAAMADSPSRFSRNLTVRDYSVGNKVFNDKAVYYINLLGGKGPQNVTIVGKLVPLKDARIVIEDGKIAIKAEFLTGSGRSGRYYRRTYRFPRPGKYKVILPLRKNWQSEFRLSNKTDDGERGNKVGPVRASWNGRVSPETVRERWLKLRKEQIK